MNDFLLLSTQNIYFKYKKDSYLGLLKVIYVNKFHFKTNDSTLRKEGASQKRLAEVTQLYKWLDFRMYYHDIRK